MTSLGRLILLLLLPLTAGAETMVNPTLDLNRLLPRIVEGWTIKIKLIIFPPKNHYATTQIFHG